jgi:hypothetical protein
MVSRKTATSRAAGRNRRYAAATATTARPPPRNSRALAGTASTDAA